MNTRQSNIPFNLGQEPVNHVEEYQWGRQLRRYIQFSSQHCSLSIHELAGLCGYRNLNKLQRRRHAWNEVRQPVPAKYLCAIGISLGLLDAVVELDQREFDEALSSLPNPDFVTIKLLPGAYRQQRLCVDTSELEAIRYMQHLVTEHHYLSCFVHWAGLKTIIVRFGTDPVYRFYRPIFVLRDQTVDFGNDGSLNGTARLL